jgi:hypothetical protein
MHVLMFRLFRFHDALRDKLRALAELLGCDVLELVGRVFDFDSLDGFAGEVEAPHLNERRGEDTGEQLLALRLYELIEFWCTRFAEDHLGDGALLLGECVGAGLATRTCGAAPRAGLAWGTVGLHTE